MKLFALDTQWFQGKYLMKSLREKRCQLLNK